MHEANHPGTVHIRNNIWQVDPRDVVKGRRVSLAWFSPDCKHFSKAKGGKPREKSIRDLAWVVVLWAQRVKPELILLENVEEFRTWGPLCDEGKPIKERAGETIEKWCKELRKAGYKLQFRELRACDYGAPTIRKRFFMIARRDGKPGSPEVLSGKRKPWRTAAEIIDWSIPCPSIFERKKPLADKTLRRIAHGIMKFVVNNPSPFIVGTAFKNTRASRVFDIDEPLRTTTAQPEYAVVSPVIVGCGGRRGQSGPVDPIGPYPTTTTKADACLVETQLAPFTSYAQQGGLNRSAEDPLHTVTASNKDHNCVAAAHLVHIGNGEREGQAPRAMAVKKPLGTVVAGGTKHHAVTAFMQKFAQNGQGVDPSEPLHTVMAGAPRHAVVCAHLEQWGFRYVTGGAWHKRSKYGKSAFGTGYVLRSASEPYLIGALGSPLTAKNVRNVIESSDLDVIDAVARGHSRKPDEQYDYCQRLAPRAVRFAELFGRQRWPGWDVWGNEADKFTPEAA